MKLNKLMWILLMMAAIINLVLVVADSTVDMRDRTYVINDGISSFRDNGVTVYTYTIDDGATDIFYTVSRLRNLWFDKVGTPSPANMLLRSGEVIKLKLVSDSDCTFNIPKYGISVGLYKDEPAELTFNADRDGVFEYYCTRYQVRDTGLMKVSDGTDLGIKTSGFNSAHTLKIKRDKHSYRLNK